MALVGNPNAGKTTLFNALTGLRAKTANFPGTTIERRVGHAWLDGARVKILDLPGLYSLSDVTAEERVVHELLLGKNPVEGRPKAVVLLVDATNLERNLYLASQVLELGLPTIVALNMVDVAEKARIDIDVVRLAADLQCQVIPVSARTGRGVDVLAQQLAGLVDSSVGSSARELSEAICNCQGCPYEARYDWAEEVGRRCQTRHGVSGPQQTDRL
ncbi:MAG: FeoB small GTPase domain-containing protein, partial [Acidobacteriota bacterium]